MALIMKRLKSAEEKEKSFLSKTKRETDLLKEKKEKMIKQKEADTLTRKNQIDKISENLHSAHSKTQTKLALLDSQIVTIQTEQSPKSAFADHEAVHDLHERKEAVEEEFK